MQFCWGNNMAAMGVKPRDVQGNYLEGRNKMKRSVITFLAVCSTLAFSASVLAQAPREHSMTGCVAIGAEPNTYLITNVEGTGPKTIGIVSSTANLAPHVGHKIQVTGTAVPAKEAETDKNVPKAEHYMRLTAIKMISTTCP
jgi:hypothetical protein